MTNNGLKKIIFLNLMQMILELAIQRIRVIRSGRGAGKSVANAIEIKNITLDMPRSKNFISQSTYQQALTRTLPSTIQGLDFLGFKKDIHYFVGRTPPKRWKWEQAYEPPLNPTHSIFFMNGTVWDLLSEEVSNRGANYSAGVGDELLEQDEEHIKSVVFPTLRARPDKFEKCKTYRRVTFFTSTPRKKAAEWIYKYENLATVNPETYLWMEFPSHVNSANLPNGWFEDQLNLMGRYEFDIEIGNIRPTGITGGFYPLFDEKVHVYKNFNDDFLEGMVDDGYAIEKFQTMDCRQDAFLQMREPIDISMDYGAWFNGIVTGQENGGMFRYMTGFSIDEKEQFEDLLEKWCAYYRPHHSKVAYYWYDHTAVGKDARTASYRDIVVKVLTNNGWSVVQKYIGQAPSHDDKYKFWSYAHKGQHPHLPKFSYHSQNCKYLIISVSNAGVKQGRNGFEKDKSKEADHSIDQRTTTHYSDAHDMIAYGKYSKRIKGTIGLLSPR